MCYTLFVEEEAFPLNVLWLCMLCTAYFFAKIQPAKNRRQYTVSRGCEKIRQKFAPNGKSGILYTRDEERKISSIHKTDSPSCSFLSLFLSPAVFAGSGAFAFCRCFAAGRIRHIGSVDKICRQYRKSKRKEIKIMTKIMEKATPAIPDTKEGIRMLPEVEICFRMI